MSTIANYLNNNTSSYFAKHREENKGKNYLAPYLGNQSYFNKNRPGGSFMSQKRDRKNYFSSYKFDSVFGKPSESNFFEEVPLPRAPELQFESNINVAEPQVNLMLENDFAPANDPQEEVDYEALLQAGEDYVNEQDWSSHSESEEEKQTPEAFCRVSVVLPNSPGHAAGFVVGDLIYSGLGISSFEADALNVSSPCNKVEFQKPGGNSREQVYQNRYHQTRGFQLRHAEAPKMVRQRTDWNVQEATWKQHWGAPSHGQERHATQEYISPIQNSIDIQTEVARRGHFGFSEEREVDDRIRKIGDLAEQHYAQNKAKLSHYQNQSQRQKELEEMRMSRKVEDLKFGQYQRFFPDNMPPQKEIPFWKGTKNIPSRPEMRIPVQEMNSRPSLQEFEEAMTPGFPSQRSSGIIPSSRSIPLPDPPKYEAYQSPLMEAYQKTQEEHIEPKEEEIFRGNEIRPPVTQGHIPWKAIEIANRLNTNQRAYGVNNFTEQYLTTPLDGVTSSRDFAMRTYKMDPLEEQQLKMLKDFKKKEESKKNYFLKRMPEQPHHCHSCSLKKQSMMKDFFEPPKTNPPHVNQATNTGKIILEAKTCLKNKKIDKAYENLKIGIMQGHTHSDIFYLFGETARLKGLLEEAEHYLLKALTFEIHSPFTYNSLGLVYFQKGDHKTAIPLFKHFINLIETPEAHFELGKCFGELKMWVESAIHFSRAVELDRENPIYYAYRADVYEAQGFNELANNDYAMILHVDPHFLKPYITQAKELEDSGNPLMANHIRVFVSKILNAYSLAQANPVVY